MRCSQIVHLGIALTMSIALCQIARSMWLPPASAPLERLLSNVQRYVQQNPKDAHGHYVLARLHSLAFARGAKTQVQFSMVGAIKPLDFGPYERFFVERPKGLGEPDKAALNHLATSIRHYRIAVKLKPEEALYWLGLGWVLEQGINFANKLAAPFLEKPRIVSAKDWRKEALNAYRQAFRLGIKKEPSKSLRGAFGLPSGSVAQEAGEAILRLQKGRRLSILERLEFERVEKEVEALKKLPRPITPIIFSLYRPLPLSELTSSHSVVFDLDGDGSKERWQWVTPKAAFLVWNGEKTGQITSGLQFFGSVTWWMFWRNGYEALAALDDDGNGWLEGKELDGIFVWHDKNSNGISERDEVLSLERFGIVRISVKATHRESEVLFNPKGIYLLNGHFLPTYDWVSKPR